MNYRVSRRLFDVGDLATMRETGLVTWEERVELLHGEVLLMPPMGALHTALIDRVNARLAPAVAGVAIVRVRGPVQLSQWSEPVPDLVLAAYRDDFYAEALPRPQDIKLVVEAALGADEYVQEVKLPLYARAEVPEVWLVMPQRRHVEVHRRPSAGAYRDVSVVHVGGVLQAQSVARAELPTAELFA
jgi:Uma2 family endonuclease